MAAAIAPSAASIRTAAGDRGWLTGVAIALMVGAMTFNFILAYVNASVTPLTPGIIVIVQGLFLVIALAVGVRGNDPDRLLWLTVLWGMVVWWLGLTLLRGSVNFKYLGDVAAFPAFALMGTVVRPRTFVPLLIGLQITILATGFWEALDPVGFGNAVDVASYYANTRGVEATIYDPDLSGLYLNAARPVGRLFFPSLDLHRVSSIFLEPVSLGNWTVVVTIFLCAFWSNLGRWTRAFLIVGNFVLLVMCDGRFALIGNIAVVGISLIATRLPRGTALAFPPAMMMALALARALGTLPSGGDTLPGRLAKSLFYFERQSLTELFGLNKDVPGYTFDSGWTYLAQTQSLLGLIAFWALLSLLLPLRSPQAKRFVVATSIFFALSMPISNSFISIKAAALLFVCYGSLRRWQREEGIGGYDPRLERAPRRVVRAI